MGYLVISKRTVINLG